MSLGAAAGGAASGAAAGTAIMPGYGTAIGAVVGGVAGALSGNGDDSQALSQDAQNQYNILNSPVDLGNALSLQQYQQGGTLTPAQIQQLNLNSDKATTLVENPQDRMNQQASLNALQQLSQSGMSAQDMAQMQQSRSQVAQDTQAKVNSLLQAQQQRGQADSGSTLAAQLQAVQSGNQQQSHDALQTAANSQQARMGALQQYANLAGQIRGQDYNTQQYNTSNEIQRQRFLDQNSLARQSTNVSAQNNAQLYNLQRSQSAQDANTGAYNSEQARQLAGQQQTFQDQLQLAAARAGQYNVQAGLSQQNAANSAQNFSNVANGVGQAAGALAKSNQDNSGNMFPSNSYGSDSFTMPSMGSQFGSSGGDSFSKGGMVPGKAPVKGDSPSNDTVHAKLSPGEIVIPRSLTQNPTIFKTLAEMFQKASYSTQK